MSQSKRQRVSSQFRLSFNIQDEKYDHIEAEEIKKVEVAVADKEKWLQNKWNAQSKLADHQDPAVYASVILSEKKVYITRFPSFLSLSVDFCFIQFYIIILVNLVK